LKIQQETYFCPVDEGSKSSYITVKTTVANETAAFVDDGTQFESPDQLRGMLDVLPTHLIVGANDDLWYSDVWILESSTS
jgi:hypothetical protein